MKLYCFGQFLCPSSGVFHCTHSNGVCHTGCELDQDVPSWSCPRAVCMTHTIAVCTVKNSWWWTEELSETCRISFQNKFEKLVHLVGFIVSNSSRCTVTWTSNLRVTYEVWGNFWSNLHRPISKSVFKVHRNNNTCLRVDLLCYVIRSETESYWFVGCWEFVMLSLWSSWVSVTLGHGALSLGE